MDYPDYIRLLSTRHQDIQEKTEILSAKASNVGLKVNEQKTQVLRRNNERTDEAIELRRKPIEDVQEITYLRSKITKDGDCTTEVNARISKAVQAFKMLRNIWKQTTLNLKPKY